MPGSLINLLKSRKVSRAIKTTRLSSDKIEMLMNAAQLSASCYNNQSWRFLFLNEEKELEKGRKALSSGNRWAESAPLLIAGFSRKDLDCQTSDGREYYLFDLGMATQLILLQATELDLIARPMAGFKPEVIREEFNIPFNYEIYVMIAVGLEGDIDSLDEKSRKKSLRQRKRNDVSANFFLNEFKEN
ncbi:nitroreductase [candidate division KSB1 bacterium]|nr:nitroreductase [candidate division KSB1 bacterium]